MTKFTTAALALCLGFSGLNAAEAATLKPSPATPAIVKPIAVKPITVKPTAVKVNKTVAATPYGTGLWEALSIASQPGGITSRAVMEVYFVPKTDEFEEKITDEGNTSTEVEAGGVIEMTGLYKKVNATTYEYEYTSAIECVTFCTRDSNIPLDKVYSETVTSLGPNAVQVNGVDWYAAPQ